MSVPSVQQPERQKQNNPFHLDSNPADREDHQISGEQFGVSGVMTTVSKD